jgi:hypothetical protein
MPLSPGTLMLALNHDRPAARLLWEGVNLNRTDRPPQGATLSTAVVAGPLSADVRRNLLRYAPNGIKNGIRS